MKPSEERSSPSSMGNLRGLVHFVFNWLTGIRRQPTNGTAALALAQKLDLGSKRSLMMVVFGERCFLLAGNAETITAMLELGPGQSNKVNRTATPRPAARQRSRPPIAAWRPHSAKAVPAYGLRRLGAFEHEQKERSL